MRALSLLLLALASSACIRAPIYPGSNLAPERVAALAQNGWTLERLDVGHGVRVAGLEKPPRSPDAPWLLFFGGNGSSIASAQAILAKIAGDEDVGLAAFAYRGFDSSDGDPSERALVQDASAIASHLASAHGAAPARLVLIGYSLGSGVAARLDAALARAKTPPRGLILVAPYTSIAKVASESIPCGGFLIADGWHTDRVAHDLVAPILIVHGADDHVIAVHHGRDLARQLGARATFVEVPHRGHDDVWRDARTLSAVHDFCFAPATGPTP